MFNQGFFVRSNTFFEFLRCFVYHSCAMKKTALLILLYFCNSYAQNDTIAVYFADSIIIHAARTSQPIYQTPYAIEIINRDRIQQGKKHISLEEVLQSVPGLFVNNRNNFAQGDRISIRGVGSRASFGVRGIKIIVDDIPLTMADGQTQLNNLDLSSAGRIEVIKGPSASLYGNAAGGVIEIQTQEIPDKQNHFEPSIDMGSYGLLRLQAKTTFRNENSNYLLNLNKFKIHGFRDHSATESWQLNALSKHHIIEKMSANAIINFYYAPYSFNPSSLTKADALNNPGSSRTFIKNQGAGEKVLQGQGGITLRFDQSKSQHLKFTVYGLFRSLINPIPAEIIELERLAGGTRLTWSRREQIAGYNYSIISGLDTEIQSDQRKRYENNGIPENEMAGIKREDVLKQIEYGEKIQQQDESVIGIAPFVKLEVTLKRDLFLTLGGRYDSYFYDVKDHFLSDNSDDSGSRTLSQFSPMAGLVYRPTKLLSYYLNFSSAFQTPTTTELGNQPSGKGGINPNLDPETITSYEFGMKGFLLPFKIRYQAAIYFMMYNKMLVPFQISDSGKEYFRNSGSSENKGFELSIEWQPNIYINTSLAYSGMNFIFNDFTIDSINVNGNKVPGVAPQKFYAALKYEHPAHYFAEIQLNWVDTYFVNDNNGGLDANSLLSDYINDAYTTLDLSFGRRIEIWGNDIQLNAAVNNILDTRYNGSVVPNAFGKRFYEPSPGRNWHAGLKVVF